MFYTVYKITNLINNKIYIGAHKTKNLEDDYMGSGKILIQSIEKHGIENFKKDILHIFDNEEEMYDKEKELVNEDFISRKDTYNIKLGGNGGFTYINENKLHLTEKHRRASLKNLEKANAKNKELVELGLHRNGFKHSEETKQKFSECRKGKQIGEENPMYNKKAITKDGVSICVHKDELYMYFQDGWQLGQIQNKPDFSGANNPQFGKIWITNGEKSLTIKQEELNNYLTLGYTRGRTLKNKCK